MDTELEKLELTLINLKNEAHENGSTHENGEGVQDGVCSRGGRGEVRRARSRSPTMRMGRCRHRRGCGLQAAARPNSLARFGKKRRDARMR